MYLYNLLNLLVIIAWSVSPDQPFTSLRIQHPFIPSKSFITFAYAEGSESPRSKPPPVPQLTKVGRKIEKTQKKLGKSETFNKEFRGEKLNKKATQAGNALKESSIRENKYETKMKEANRNPTTLSSKFRSMVPGTMENKYKQATKESNKRAKVLTNVLHDTNTFKIQKQISKPSVRQVKSTISDAMRHRYAPVGRH